jgi:hypothetical protein
LFPFFARTRHSRHGGYTKPPQLAQRFGFLRRNDESGVSCGASYFGLWSAAISFTVVRLTPVNRPTLRREYPAASNR